VNNDGQYEKTNNIRSEGKRELHRITWEVAHRKTLSGGWSLRLQALTKEGPMWIGIDKNGHFRLLTDKERGGACVFHLKGEPTEVRVDDGMLTIKKVKEECVVELTNDKVPNAALFHVDMKYGEGLICLRLKENRRQVLSFDPSEVTEHHM